MEKIIEEVRNAKRYLLTGQYELAFVAIQNVDDELTTRELKKEPFSATKH